MNFSMLVFTRSATRSCEMRDVLRAGRVHGAWGVLGGTIPFDVWSIACIEFSHRLRGRREE